MGPPRGQPISLPPVLGPSVICLRMRVALLLPLLVTLIVSPALVLGVGTNLPCSQQDNGPCSYMVVRYLAQKLAGGKKTLFSAQFIFRTTS
jgi:hypothetical protein